jgi:triacylglycerol lipase
MREMNIVLVHGFLDQGSVMNPLAGFLKSCGHNCFIVTLKPNDARCGLVKLSEQLSDFVDSELGKSSQFAIIGFSMGAVISRYYLQELGGYKRAEMYISISGPHSGTLTSYLYFSKGARQMRPNSDFLSNLKASSSRLENIQKVCYWTPYDLMIIPASSCKLNDCANVKIPALLHPLMLFDKRLFLDIRQRLSEMQAME